MGGIVNGNFGMHNLIYNVKVKFKVLNFLSPRFESNRLHANFVYNSLKIIYY